MTLQVIYSSATGTTLDISSRVFMASERLGLPGVSVTHHAEEGSVSHSTLTVDDPSGTLTLLGHRRVYLVETAAPTGQQVIGNWFTGTKTIDRGDWRVGPLARTYNVALDDANTLISRRIVVGSDGNRPAETDVQRIAWLLTTTEANQFNGSTTYVNTVNATAMDAVDYRGQGVDSILNDCAQATGKNYWIIYIEALGQYSLWYDFAWSTVYSSAIRLSNDPADIDDATTFAYFLTSTLTQDPGRVYSATYLPFDGSPGWVYVQKTATGNAHVFRDASYPSFNVKSETKARARAARYNDDSDTEEDVVKVSFVVSAANVNALMQGMRVEAKGTHWPGYTAFTWMRALNRTVTQLSPAHYRIDAELSPPDPPVDSLCCISWPYNNIDQGAPGGPDLIQDWRNSGDDFVGGDAPPKNTPTRGLMTKVQTGSKWSLGAWDGIRMDGSGNIRIEWDQDFLWAYNGSGNTATWAILLNDTVVNSVSALDPGSGAHGWLDDRSGVNRMVLASLAVTNGDVIRARLTFSGPNSPPTSFFASPSGAGYGPWLVCTGNLA